MRSYMGQIRGNKSEIIYLLGGNRPSKDSSGTSKIVKRVIFKGVIISKYVMDLSLLDSAHVRFPLFHLF